MFVIAYSEHEHSAIAFASMRLWFACDMALNKCDLIDWLIVQSSFTYAIRNDGQIFPIFQLEAATDYCDS